MPQQAPEPRWRTVRIGRGKTARTVKVRIVRKGEKRAGSTPQETQ